MTVSAEGRSFPSLPPPTPGTQTEGFLRSTEKEEQGEGKGRCGSAGGGRLGAWERGFGGAAGQKGRGELSQTSRP